MPSVSELLRDAGIRLFHAMNLGGFSEYVRAQAVICREDLLAGDPHAAPFRSDPTDAAHGVLGRVFGNLNDFGAIYARAYRTLAVPNIYGPIQIEFPSSIWPSLSDVVLTRASVMTLGADWRARAIVGAELEQLILGCVAGCPQSPYSYTEASAMSRAIPLRACTRIIVEPITIGGRRLLETVQQMVQGIGLLSLVVERIYSNTDSIERLQEEADGLLAYTEPLPADRRLVYTPPRAWMAGAPGTTIDRWGQWATNYYRDTVQYVRRTAAGAAPPPSARAWLEELEGRDDFDESAAFRAFHADCASLDDQATADDIVEVFMRHFMDPANGVPHDSGEGGYLYVGGGPYDPEDVLRDAFEDTQVDEDALEDAISQLYSEGAEWVFADQY